MVQKLVQPIAQEGTQVGKFTYKMPKAEDIYGDEMQVLERIKSRHSSGALQKGLNEKNKITVTPIYRQTNPDLERI